MDIRIENHGSIVLLRPVTTAGHDWLNVVVPSDVLTWGEAIVVEPRYVGPILERAIDAGLEVD